MTTDFDIAVIGSGFGGSLLAMIAKRLGRSVILLERGQHPRFAIGESSTPLANLLIEELAGQYELPRLLPLSKWGTWQKTYPEIACGLKRGFTFYHHTFGQPWTENSERNNELLVAASPHDGIADTHWYRPDFDHFFVREAQAEGIEYIDRIKLEKAVAGPEGFTLHGEREGETLSVKAKFVVDAGGGRGFFSQQANPAQPFPHLPPTEGLYTHFRGVGRFDEIHPSMEKLPYPVDDATLHHVFDGGWIWVIPFNNGIASAGVAMTSALARELRLEEGAPAWDRLLERLPAVRRQFARSKAEFPFIYRPQLAFRCEAVVGENWALLPSAAGFIDPLLSTGFPLTLLGITRLARIIQKDWGRDSLASKLRAYEQQTLKDLDSAALMVGALYANMNNFPMFARLSLLYFAAATFTEAARRLGRPELADSAFLMAGHPFFGPRSRACYFRALRTRESEKVLAQLGADISETIAPVDVAGLGAPAARNWFPVNASDLFSGAHKLNATREEIHQLLVRCGFDSVG